MNSRTLLYADITLEPVDISEMLGFGTVDTEIQYDYFDSIVADGGIHSGETYRIRNQTDIAGYVALYRIDAASRTADTYGKINGKQHYGDLIKAFLALLGYAFMERGLRKLGLVYCQGNYLLEDVCNHLHFVREGLLREHLDCDGEFFDVNVYGMLDYEYRRFAAGMYKRMFAWDYSFHPQKVVLLDLTGYFNRRLFTNSLDNPNNAQINDLLREYVMNWTIQEEHCLVYKDVKFPVRIFDPGFEFDCFLCGKQEISVPEERYTDLLLVSTAQFGNRQTYITAVYEDGTREECEFSVGDWCERIARNEHIIHYAAACRNLGEESNMVKCDAFVYLQRVCINCDKQLKRLIFPMECNEIFIFAGALCVA